MTLFFPKNELIGTSYALKIALITLLRMLPTIFSLEIAVMSTRSMIRESQVSSKKSLYVRKCFVSVTKLIVVMINRLNSTRLAARDLIKKTLEDCGVGGPMAKYLKVMDESVDVTSTNRGFRTIQHSVATYEQIKKRLSYYDPKRKAEEDGIHTKPLQLLVLIIVLIV